MKSIIAIGGSGARSAESFVYYAASGAYTACEKNEEITIYVIDKDVTNGNIDRLKQTVGAYMSMKEKSGFPITDIKFTADCMYPSFRIEVFKLDDYLKLLSDDFETYADMARESDSDQLLLNMFHTKEEQNTPLSEGFWGRPDLGAPIAKMIFDLGDFHDNPMFRKFRTALNNPDSTIDIVLTGSVFGGTGATFFPNLANKIRTSVVNDGDGAGKALSDRITVNGVLMLPYFTFPEKPADNDNNGKAEAGIDPKCFKKKAAVALKSYGKRGDSFVKINGKGAVEYDFDSLQLIGSSHFDETSSSYSKNGNGQISKFTITDLYAAASIATAFEKKLKVTDNSKPCVFLYNHNHGNDKNEISVSDINNLSSDPSVKPGQLLIDFTEFAYAVTAILRPDLERTDVMDADYMIKSFGRNRDRDSDDRGRANVDIAGLKSDVDSVCQFCDRYIDYIISIFDTDLNDVNFLNISDLIAMKNIRDQNRNNVQNIIDQLQIRRNYKHIDPIDSHVFIPNNYFEGWRASGKFRLNDGLQRILVAFYNGSK